MIAAEWRYKLHAFVIFMFSIAAFVTAPDASNEIARALTIDEYANDVGVSVLWDGVTGLILVSLLFFDKLASRQALLLAFAVVCHIMVYCYLKEDPEWLQAIAAGFYYFYDELIILICLMQMAASYNGFISAYINALRELQNFVLRSKHCSNYFRKGLLSRKKREIKT